MVDQHLESVIHVADAIANDIKNLAEGARHNIEACRYISACVQKSLSIIAHDKYALQDAIREPQRVYESVLSEIKLYLIEIVKPGKFTERAKAWLMNTTNANNIAAANEKLLKKLTDATNNFYGNVVLDNNDKIIDEQEGRVAVEIMIESKTDIQMDEALSPQIDRSHLKDIDDDYCDIVSKGNIKKQLYNEDKVAVKRMRSLLRRPEFIKQIKIIKLLGNHKRIEKFYGIYVENEDFFVVVTEWMQNGNLEGYLKKDLSIPWQTKLKIAGQIAEGLIFCNKVGVYHQNVRSKNILLDENLNSKLTNFELGRTSSEMSLESLRWSAPEKFKYPKQPYTDKCEVYSFAILLWEISAHKLPFYDIEIPIKAAAKAEDGGRPNPFKEDTPEQYKRIVIQAWQQNPIKRPSIDEIRKLLRRMRNEENGDSLNWDSSAIFQSETLVPYDSENVTSSPVLSIDQIVSLHEKKQYKDAFPQFRKLADEGNPVALYYAGLYLYEGYGTEKDEIQALQLLQISADSGEPRGQYMYAYACLKGSYYSPEEGLRYLKKTALINNNPDALYIVSQLFLNGEHGYPINNDKYLSYLKKAANGGSEEAKGELEMQKNNGSVF